MQVVWEANTADFHKRKRAAKACLSCQKRKKRCRHTFDQVERSEDSTESHLDAGQGTLVNGDGQISPEASVIRFVGDMNPESIVTRLLSRPRVDRPSLVGTWIEPPAADEEQQSSLPSNSAVPNAHNGSRRVVNIHQERYLRELGAFRVLPQSTQNVLVTLYFSCIDVVLPLFDDGVFLQKFREGTASNLLINAICLVSCKTEDATDFLRFSLDGPVLPPLTFARVLYAGLEAAMKTDMESDRITKIQILALLSLHNDGASGMDECSIHLTQAIHHAHTAGLHLHFESGGHPQHPPRLLYWTLWSLDKINASLVGRPVTIADRDIGVARPNLTNEPVHHGFVIWLELSDLLARVISWYRPTVRQDATGWEEDFPSFEHVVDAKAFASLQQSHQDIVEMFYNLIAILTCRAGGPSTTSYRRRAFAASRIQAIATARETDLHIPPLPIVPYAVSLSMTVAYRLLRDSKSLQALQIAQRDLTYRVEVLERLSVRWSTAAAMAKLGRKALKSLEAPISDDPSHLSNQMEGFVAPCRFHDRSPAAENAQAASASGLDVLSTAAEAHASAIEQRPLSTTQVLDPALTNDPSTAQQSSELPDLNFNFEECAALDALFGDFVDLSMPTLFQDPLFENDYLLDLPQP